MGQWPHSFRYQWDIFFVMGHLNFFMGHFNKRRIYKVNVSKRVVITLLCT